MVWLRMLCFPVGKIHTTFWRHIRFYPGIQATQIDSRANQPQSHTFVLAPHFAGLFYSRLMHIIQ
jgi:hypothetical protein